MLAPDNDMQPMPEGGAADAGRWLQKNMEQEQHDRMTVQGVSHITLIVQDLQRTEELLSSVLGARKVYESGEEMFSLSKERFFLLGGTWIAIMEGSPLSERTYNHISFKIPESEFEDYKERLEKAKVEFREGRPRVHGEGLSLYFYDYDNHLFELHTGTLEERLQAYEKHANSDPAHKALNRISGKRRPPPG
jgi:catechol 2,3-dioxygenase-like lactoylglutathione lyase family enzyme